MFESKNSKLMKKLIIIGDKTFPTKKSAKTYFSDILNSYDFDESLSNNHCLDLVNLLNYYLSGSKNETLQGQKTTNKKTQAESNEDFYIKDIRIARFQFNTKCFEFVPSIGNAIILSYKSLIDKPKINQRTIFNRVCRYTIQDDLIKVKQDYFKQNSKNSKAPCQESKKFFKFEDLEVDHRQPNTLSVIIDRFIELNQIEIDKVEYKFEPYKLSSFKSSKLTKSFKDYHKDKALLRVVEKSLNHSRSGLARLQVMKDDLKIDN